MSVRARDPSKTQCCKIPQAPLPASSLTSVSSTPAIQASLMANSCLPFHPSSSSQLLTSSGFPTSTILHHLWFQDTATALMPTVTLALTEWQTHKMAPLPQGASLPSLISLTLSWFPVQLPALIPHIPPSVDTSLSRKPSLTPDQTRTPIPQPLGQAFH